MVSVQRRLGQVNLHFFLPQIKAIHSVESLWLCLGTSGQEEV